MLHLKVVIKAYHLQNFQSPMDLLNSNCLSTVTTAAALGIGLCTITLLLWRSMLTSKGQRYYPTVGTIYHQLIYFRKLHHFHTDLSAKYKSFTLFAVNRNCMYTVDPTIVEYILKTNFSNYGKGSYNHDKMKDLLGDGIFAVDGEKWRHQRKLASYEFSTKVLRDFSSDVFRSNASRLALTISEAANSEKSIDIQDLFMRSTLDSIFQVGFGVRLDTLSRASEEGSRFAKAFDSASDLILWRYVDIFWKIKRVLRIGSEAELRENIRVIDDFIYQLIESKAKSLCNQHADDTMREDILSRFLVESKKDPVKMNNQYLRDIILNFIIAGRDTTAVTLSWFFYMLCKHPSLQEKLAREVNEATTAVDEPMPIIDFTSRLTEESLDRMQYLHASLAETLRLYPAIPEDPKICLSDDKLPDGFDVRKGDMVCYLPYSMGRMKFLWGEDAEIFRPERWFNENGVFQPENPFKFTAFQAGPRICLGKEFAYRQMKIFAAVLVRSFRFKLCDDREVNYKTTITLRIDQGLHLLAYQR